MSVKMVVTYRKKPSLARRRAAEAEKAAELDRIVKEEVRFAAIAMGITYATPRGF